MMEDLTQFHGVFLRTQNGIHAFMDILSPAITNSQDEHERLYYHHIFEEEEQRLERLELFIPKLARFIENEQPDENNHSEFITLLQDINLEKFGLHNFLEHLDLALYQFKDEERAQTLTSMLEQTRADYLTIKDILTRLNERYFPNLNGSRAEKPSEHHHVLSAAHEKVSNSEHSQSTVTVNTLTTLHPITQRKGLTVGSLKK